MCHCRVVDSNKCPTLEAGVDSGGRWRVGFAGTEDMGTLHFLLSCCELKTALKKPI